MTDLLKQLKSHTPWNAQEARDLPILIRHLENTPDVFTRQSETAHFTASAWVVSPDRTKVLMAYHNLYNSWAWLGGHADGETDLSRTAIREAMEESGLQHVRLVSEEPLSVEILTVNGHEKKGSYVPSHLHLNVTYLLEADPAEPIHIRPEENSGVDWIPVEEIPDRSSEPWFCERIYSKLCDKVRAKYPPNPRIIEVAAALIWQKDRFFVCQRPENKARARLWEFPGGKIEPGETGEEALIRECREELDITLTVESLCTDVTHAYPELTVHLTLYNAVIREGSPKLLEHKAMQWIRAEEIPALEFCPADQAFFPAIRKEAEKRRA